jgi:hypothetical protein
MTTAKMVVTALGFAAIIWVNYWFFLSSQRQR